MSAATDSRISRYHAQTRPAPAATQTDYWPQISDLYDMSSELHAELERVRASHGHDFSSDPHYVLLSTALDGLSAARNALRVVNLANNLPA